MSKETRYIRALLTEVSSQRLQYKPYGYKLDFNGGDGGEEILVEMEIPGDTVLEEISKDPDNDIYTDQLVISLDGLNAILKVTADSLDKLDRECKEELMHKAEVKPTKRGGN